MNNSKQLIMPSDLISDVFTTTSISNSPSNNYARCGLWDFAGQKEFYCTHQAFLTSSAIYLVVVDMKTDFVTEQKKHYTTEDDISSLSDLQEEDYVGFWFDSIHCYRTVDPQDGEASMDPPVVVVFTGKDRYDQSHIEKGMKEKHSQILQTCSEHMVENLYNVDMICEYLEIDDILTQEIRDKIKHKNGRQKQTKELLSTLPNRGEKAYERFIEA
ncbi:uncharacterized protein LOC143057346 [Mytilus galloprovincialis]|uniref:uncharacterized protein LOC143057346 n=1 Tax=Mytilus galloprovincialis TaxID=29158 RepID=UPI003F7C42FA